VVQNKHQASFIDFRKRKTGSHNISRLAQIWHSFLEKKKSVSFTTLNFITTLQFALTYVLKITHLLQQPFKVEYLPYVLSALMSRSPHFPHRMYLFVTFDSQELPKDK
jgi:hypothetical protein